MIRDLRSDPLEASLETDVCIVGAGAAGLTLAIELSAFTRVVLLESGGLRPGEDMAPLTHGEICGLPFEGLERGRVWSFGGTTTVWGGQCLEIDDIAFEHRDWVPHSGWPFPKRELRSFYQRARQLLHAPNPDEDRLTSRRFAQQRPAFDVHRIDCRLSVVNPRLDFGALHRDTLARSNRVQVLLHAHASEIRTTRSGDAVSGVEVRTLGGRAFHVAARTVVLCGGAIENARLLLLSNRTEAAGIGNRHDMVGRFFQDHPTFELGTLTSRRRGAVHAHFSVLRHGALRFLPRVHLSEAVQRHERVLGCIADIVYDHDAHSGHGAVRELAAALRGRHWPTAPAQKAWRVIRDAPSLVATGYQRLARGALAASASSTPRLLLQLEQAPHPMSRVSLSHDRDPLGRNRARVDWRLTDIDRRTADTMAAVVAPQFARLGMTLDLGDWRSLDPTTWLDRARDAYHHMGTTRMASDASNGVVDANCQVHGVAGLFVCGSSVFPAAGTANPTLTIVALAVRLAAHLEETRGA